MISLVLTAVLASADLMEFQSDGGARLVVAPGPTPIATVVIQFRTGLAAEDETESIARVSRQALLEANRKIDVRSLRERLFAANADLVTRSTWNRTSYTLTASSRDLDALLPDLLRALLQPQLDEARLQKLMKMQLPAVGTGSMFDGLGPTLVQRDRKEQGPAPLTLPVIKRHIATQFVPANADVLVAGGVDLEALKRSLSSLTGGRRVDERPLLLIASAETTLRGRREEHLVMSSFDRSNPTAMASLRTMSEVLNQAILEPLRKQGATYAVEVGPYLSAWANLLVILIPVGDSQKFDFKVVMSGALDPIKRSTVPKALFDAAHAHAVQLFEATLLDSRALASCLADSDGDARWCGPMAREALASLTLEAFHREATRFVTETIAYRVHVLRASR